MIEMIFKNKFEFNTKTALNGKIALDIFRQLIVDFQNDDNNSTNYYNAIILDLNMPIMGGYEACKLIKETYSQYMTNVLVYGRLYEQPSNQNNKLRRKSI